MEINQFTPMIAAFICLFSLVWMFGMSLDQTLKSRDNEWAKIRSIHPTLLEAVSVFTRDTLLSMLKHYPTIERLLRRVKKDLARAGEAGDANDWVAEALWQGLVTALICTIVIILLGGFSGLVLGPAIGAMWALWIKPSLLESNAIQRTRLIYRRIPYALDLSVLVLETGGTLREGLEEIAQQEDPLAEELRLTLLEMDSGASQGVALKNMGERIGLESLETILTAINRGEETGAPMVSTLVTQAEMFRARRLQEVEKMAVEAPTKMTFPNMMIMVSVLLLIIGPLLIQLVSSGMF